MALSVEDQLAIQQLYAKYNHAIDSGNGAGWAATFAADGVFSSATGTFPHRATIRLRDRVPNAAKDRHWTNNW